MKIMRLKNLNARLHWKLSFLIDNKNKKTKRRMLQIVLLNLLN